MARFAKGRIAPRRKKRSNGPVIREDGRMSAHQHNTYVALLRGDDHQDRTLPTHLPHPAPPQAKRIKSLSSLEHPDRKRARINKNLVEAFDAASSAVIEQHGTHPNDPLLRPTTLELPSTVHDKFRVIIQRIFRDQPECVPEPDVVADHVVAPEILFKLIKAMDVHGLSAAKVNEIRQILPRTVIFDKIRGGIAALNQTIIDSLGLCSEANYAAVDVTKTITWLIENRLIPDERRSGLLFSGDGRSTGRKMSSVALGVQCLNLGRNIAKLKNYHVLTIIRGGETFNH